MISLPFVALRATRAAGPANVKTGICCGGGREHFAVALYHPVKRGDEKGGYEPTLVKKYCAYFLIGLAELTGMWGLLTARLQLSA